MDNLNRYLIINNYFENKNIKKSKIHYKIN